MTDIYNKLRKRLDDMATGYPATKSGIEGGGKEDAERFYPKANR